MVVRRYVKTRIEAAMMNGHRVVFKQDDVIALEVT